ncbi:cAMP-dependent protein kinase regulatory subunit [Hondaea fermentalgiana]|uniref:cAMP-dependent protein kinase regulatory subunit n=1 Tax=Hondaea fermentalgiana TaxID=2315210 RepID=A0A2R5GIC3_9STRA|nr:cAMP-dependent protein kinase regulatory subunit [Hondaea fermentalgiana]|eukprot:GBG27624.1 cAMP-dependent protein kinase regulatory subunit [Hondaea fermentalgiana]
MGTARSKPKTISPSQPEEAKPVVDAGSVARENESLKAARAQLENANAELKHILEQTKEENKRRLQEVENHKCKIASLTVEINQLKSGEDDTWEAGGAPYLRHLKASPGDKRVSAPKDAAFTMSRHNINKRVSAALSSSLASSSTSGASSFGGTKSNNDTYNRGPSRIAKQLNLHLRGKKSKQSVAFSSLDSNTNMGQPGGGPQSVYHLPRGGVYVHTKAGPVQFGIPPETVKDSMNLGLEVPTLFVVPRERFNMQAGINVSEIEFPAFFNFFVRKRQMTLITYQDCSEDLLTIMKEALDGPDEDQLYINEEYSRFASEDVLAARPDHVKEMAVFCEPRPGTPAIKVSNLVKFAYFNALGECRLDNDVVIKDESFGFTVLQEDTLLAAISDDEASSCFFPGMDPTTAVPRQPASLGVLGADDDPENSVVSSPSATLETPISNFSIPRFGMTILGNSHGFDALGSTSGFVIWINGQGIMVDPPPHSGEFLKMNGIQPKLITATILTHCHADHDAGTIQKVITEDKVTLMTTKTIFQSLLRKYSGVAGLGSDFLRQLVNFRPVFVEEPTYWGGASFRFFYSLHAIPCVGFEVTFEGKSMVYSADTFYEPKGLEEMHERGVLSRARCDALLNFPWHSDLVLHEAGVPPIHTPISAFDSLPPEHRANIQLIHIGNKDQANAIAAGLKVSQPGLENTAVLIPNTDTQDTLRFMQLIAGVDIFRGFPIPQALELLLMSTNVDYQPGQIIAEKGTPGDKFMVIMSGEASVSFGKTKKVFKVGDYLGEISVITGEDRTATIVAETACTIVEVDKYAFHYFLMKDKKLYAKMECLVRSRMDGSWHAIARNSLLRRLSAAQKTSLQAFLHRRQFKRGDEVWRKGSTGHGAVLILSGDFVFEEVHNADPFELLTATRHPHQKRAHMAQESESLSFDPLTTGCFVCDLFAMSANAELTVTLKCDSDEGVLFYITQENVLGFLDANPMTLLTLLKTIVIL